MTVLSRVRLAVSSARAGLVEKIEQPDANFPLFDIFFAHRIVPSQIEMVNSTALKVIDSNGHLMTVKAPADWLPKLEADFEPLVLGPRAVNQHLVAFTCVCSVCHQQYDAICTRQFADEQRLADLEGIYRKRCPICEKIESRKTLQPHFSNLMPLNPLPPITSFGGAIIPVPEPQVIHMPPLPAPTSREVAELVIAAESVLAWHRTMAYSHTGAPHRRLANALKPFEQQPAALELVK